MTGTDTEIGKTHVCAALAAAAEAEGRPWRYLKPAESGGGASDAAFVGACAGRPERAEAVYRLDAPLAPWFAAEAAGVAIDPAEVARRAAALAGAQPLIVEGAGGLLAPYGERLSGADLAAKLGLPLVVVVGNRLGCLNHALLTVEAAERRGLRVLGCVFNDLGGDGSVARNVGDFRRLSTIPVHAWLRRLAPGELPSAAWWREGERRARA